MPIPLTSAADFTAHLARLGLTPGCDVVVHSSLLAFGRIEGGAAGAYAALRGYLGEAATVAVPTFTTGLKPEHPFDVAATPSQAMGALSEHVRRLPGACRSLSPMHSYAAVGPRAGLLRDADFTLSFGPGSVFELLCRADFRLLLLGCAFEDGATHVHQIEAEVGVPYRSWLALERRIMGPDGGGHRLTYRYYGRDLDDDRPWSSAPIFARLAQAGLVRTEAAPLGASHLVALSDVQKTGEAMLRADPWLLVAASARS